MPDSDASLETAKKIFLEKNKILNNSLSINFILMLACIIVVYVVLYNVKYIKIWYLASVAVIAIRFIFHLFYLLKPEHYYLHRNLFIIGVVLMAILWGILGSYLLSQTHNDQQVMLAVIIIVGVTAVGVLSLHASLIASILFSIITTFPLTLWFFSRDEITYYMLGVGSCIYTIFSLVFCFRSHKMLNTSLHLRYENLNLIENLSSANIVLKNANESLERQEHEMTALNKMNEMLQLCQTSKEVYSLISHTAQKLFPLVSGALFYFNKLSNNLIMAEQWGTLKINKSVFSGENCWAFRSGNTYIIDNPNFDIVCYHFNTKPTNGYICLPLIVRSQITGVLNFIFPEENSMTKYKRQLMVAFSEVVKLSIANIQLQEALQDEASHDPLTGLFNRRYLNDTLPREIVRMIREKQTLCVAMLDLDHFKQFNDNTGHDAGDEVLKFLAGLLRRKFRGSDITCRFGGEEFIIVMLNTTLEGALPRLESIRKELKEAKLQFQGEILPEISISIGVAEAPTQANTPETIVRLADNALYEAKNNGRDQIIIAKF